MHFCDPIWPIERPIYWENLQTKRYRISLQGKWQSEFWTQKWQSLWTLLFRCVVRKLQHRDRFLSRKVEQKVYWEASSVSWVAVHSLTLLALDQIRSVKSRLTCDKLIRTSQRLSTNASRSFSRAIRDFCWKHKNQSRQWTFKAEITTRFALIEAFPTLLNSFQRCWQRAGNSLSNRLKKQKRRGLLTCLSYTRSSTIQIDHEGDSLDSPDQDAHPLYQLQWKVDFETDQESMLVWDSFQWCSYRGHTAPSKHSNE